MEKTDVIVVGGGISGVSFAFRTAEAGLETRLLESAPRLGGCLHSHRTDGADGFWYELGAHTAYNSYGGLLDIIEGCGLTGRMLPRHKVPFRLLKNGELRSIMKELSLVRAALSFPRIFVTNKDDKTVEQYYSRLVGRRNYDEVLGPFLAAVPSQSADEFPATMLFKKRPRRKDVMRSFTLDGGLGSIPDAIAAQPRITAETGVPVSGVARAGDGFEVQTADGATHTAGIVAVAVPPPAAAEILRAGYPELAAQLERIASTPVETTGVAVDKAKLSLEPVAGIVPADDTFYSAVSRDTVPDSRYRGFAFHFKPGQDRDARLDRIAAVLGVTRDDLIDATDKRATLPSPRLGHGDITRAIDRLIAGERLAVTGNYFAGLAIEDCIERSNAEAARVTRAV